MTDVSEVLRAEHLTRRFGERVAVEGVSLEIAAGETYGLLGPNGAGKTTTISMIAGILAPDAGQVTVCGRPLSGRHAGAAKSAIGLVPQDIALYGELSATENLRFFGRLQGLGGKTLERRIGAVLEVVGLTDRAADKVDDYSGGMKRRANIAAGLLHEPKLLILDEPTVGVDPQSRNQILASIEELGGAGLAVLYTTHYMEEAERLCDRVGIIDSGRIVAQGTRRELVERIGAHDTVELTIEDATGIEPIRAAVAAAPGVLSATVTETGVVLSVESAATHLADLVARAGSSGARISSVEVLQPDLETVFLTLTGRALRDES